MTMADEPASTRTGKIRVLLVDDDDLMRAGLRMIIEQTDDLMVAAEAADGAEAVDLVMADEFDVIVMDIRMPKLDGVEATRRIASRPGSPRTLILTTFDDDEHVFAGLRAGASGFMLKRTSPEQLLDGIRTVADGDALLSPSVTRRVIEQFGEAGPSRSPDPRLHDLTGREREVLVAMAKGWSNQEISDRLFIAANTTKTHVKHVLTKLGARDPVQAVVVAYEGGLMD